MIADQCPANNNLVAGGCTNLKFVVLSVFEHGLITDDAEADFSPTLCLPSRSLCPAGRTMLGTVFSRRFRSKTPGSNPRADLELVHLTSQRRHFRSLPERTW